MASPALPTDGVPPETPLVLKALMWSALASFGGAVKYISTVLRSSERVSNRRFVALLLGNAFVSSFCGMMGGLLMVGLGLGVVWQWIGAGAFGYLGTQGLDIVLLALRKKIDPSAPLSSVLPVPPVVDTASSTTLK